MKFFFCLLLVVCTTATTYGPGFQLANIESYSLLASSNDSNLYSVLLEGGAAYDYPAYVVDLHGSRFQMGYDYAVLVADQIVANMNALENYILPSSWKSWERSLVWGVFEGLLNWQWNDFLSQQVPPQYMEEFAGGLAGGKDLGRKYKDVGNYMTQMIVIGNIPSDGIDMKYVFLNEFQSKITTRAALDIGRLQLLEDADFLEEYVAVLCEDKQFLQELWDGMWRGLTESRRQRQESGQPGGMQCSMFSVWGTRSINNELYSARNLDYAQNLGTNVYKQILNFHPNDGAYAHTTIGFAGTFGCLAGMSSQGLTVHEANLESDQETFIGFPWLIRLRWVMENAANLAEGKTLWERSNNTIGYNHMIGSAVDAAPMSHAALALETMYNFTAYFYDDDPREADGMLTRDNKTFHYGFPKKEALWRTNHGYAPRIREHYMWKNMSAGKWSLERYMFAWEMFTFYENHQTPIGMMEAVNITSVLGDKGHTAYHCPSSPAGTNIISATFHPAANQMYVAWDNGADDKWSPAACNTYILFDMSHWW